MKKTFFLSGFLLCCCAVTAQNTYHEISLPALMKKYRQDASNMVIVDVRTKGEYYDTASRFRQAAIGHIKGAIHIEVQDMDQKPESLKVLDNYRDKEIYLICSHSYRSRTASDILLKNGFKHVNNVQGGMTEWFRRYEDLVPYQALYETTISYTNISSAQLYDQLVSNKDILLIGINIIPRTFYDSATQTYLGYVPAFKKAVYFSNTDSVKILELAKKITGKPVVLFNNYSNGAAEIADWLVKQGITNVAYLVGGVGYFMEYVANKNLAQKAAPVLTTSNNISFITPLHYCNELAGKQNITLIDVRHDTLFNKVNQGIKNNYTHLKNSVNFNAEKGSAAFEKAYPDKKTHYVFISRSGNDGLNLADELSKKGYQISWVMGGISRWDWYSINVETFKCGAQLLR